MTPRSVSLLLLFPTVTAMLNLPPLVAQDPGLQPDRWSRAALEWVGLLAEGDFEAAGARVDPAVPEGSLGPAQLEAIWAQLSGQLGELLQVAPGTVDQVQTYHRANLRAAFQRSELIIRVVLDPESRVSGFFILPPEPPAYQAPDYVDPEAFTEVDVTVGGEPWAVPGVLTLPEGPGPFPGVVLVHGSGPNDRDETLGGNRPFRDLAWGLGSRGIAVLRYDKRTRVHGATLPRDIGLEEEVVEDALLAVGLLRGREEVEGGKVFLLGHSLGAMLAPEIGLRDGALAGVALLAAPLRPFLGVLRSQLEYIASLEEDPNSEARSRLDSLLTEVDRARRGEMGAGETLLGVPVAYWEELTDLDPLRDALRLTIPLLVMQGGRDYQSTAEDFRLWEVGLKDRENTELRFYPGLSHLFIPGEGMATPEEYSTQTGHVAEEVIQDLAAWMKAVGSSVR